MHVKTNDGQGLVRVNLHVLVIKGNVVFDSYLFVVAIFRSRRY